MRDHSGFVLRRAVRFGAGHLHRFVPRHAVQAAALSDGDVHLRAARHAADDPAVFDLLRPAGAGREPRRGYGGHPRHRHQLFRLRGRDRPRRHRGRAEGAVGSGQNAGAVLLADDEEHHPAAGDPPHAAGHRQRIRDADQGVVAAFRARHQRPDDGRCAASPMPRSRRSSSSRWSIWC